MSRWRRRAVLAPVAAVLAVAGIATAAWMDRSAPSTATGTAPSTSPPRATTGRTVVLRQGDQVLGALPPLTGTGRILLTTPSCRLELLDLAHGSTSPVRPDLEVCDAVAAPLPHVAVGDVEVDGSPVLRWIGRSAADDRDVFSAFDQIPGRVVGRNGGVAGCFSNVSGFTGVVYVADLHRPPRVYGGCQAAWWNGSLVRLDTEGAIASTSGATVAVAPAGPVDERRTGRLAASRDERTLAALVRNRDGWRLAIYVAGQRRPLATVRAAWSGADAPARLRVSPDGRLYALADGLGRWTVARTDATTPPARDVASLPVLDVAFAPDSRAVAVVTARRLVFLDPVLLAPIASAAVVAKSIDWVG